MQKTNRNLMLCGMVFAVALVVSNIVAAKTVMTGFTLFGSPVVVPSAVVCYFLTFLMTDVVGELWGRKEAAQIVKWGFVWQKNWAFHFTIKKSFPWQRRIQIFRKMCFTAMMR